MAHYLFIESKDPLEDRGSAFYLDTALGLSRDGHPVTVFFVENGAHATREGARFSHREALVAGGVSLKVDDFALRERGIAGNRLAPGIAVSQVEEIVHLLADSETKAVWH